jgi:uncharacterized FlgJ-related protein
MADTLKLWEMLQQKKYQVILSDLTHEEVMQCNTQKKATLIKYMASIDYSRVPITPQQNELSQKYLQHKVLSQTDRADLLHIACSVLNYCDYIVSWNFKHFVNIKTISRVNSVNLLFGLHEVKIVSPTMLLWGI